jgi:hypothetical protein|tara:strand:+ start:371 stop:613 length:243 start_codon:yes stop_codon:yes gene_type:complete
MCDAIIICRRKKKVFSRSQTFTSSRRKDIIIIESSNTVLAPITFGAKKIRQKQLDVKQQKAFPSEPKLKKRRSHVRDMYI